MMTTGSDITQCQSELGSACMLIGSHLPPRPGIYRGKYRYLDGPCSACRGSCGKGSGCQFAKGQNPKQRDGSGPVIWALGDVKLARPRQKAESPDLGEAAPATQFARS